MGTTTQTAAPRVVWWATALLRLVAIGGALGVLAAVWITLSGRVIGTAPDPYLHLQDLPQVTQTNPVGDGLHVIDEPFWLRLLAYSPAMVVAASTMLACWWGVEVIRQIAAGRPFAPGVVSGVRRIGLVLAGGGQRVPRG